MSSGIYRITNRENGHKYIGSSETVEIRKTEHFRHLRHNKHHSAYLQNAYNLYGVEAFQFDVVEYCESGDLLSREQYYIDLLSPEYNIAKYVTSPMKGRKHTEESIYKMRVSSIGKNVGNSPSEETRHKLSVAMKGKKQTEEHKNNLSKSKTGIGLGKKLSQEHKEKIAKSNKGKIVPMERRAKLSVSLIEFWKNRKIREDIK